LELYHVDEFIDDLLHSERCCDIILPRIQKRHILEQNEELEPRVSALDDDLSEVDSDEEGGGDSPPPAERRSPSPSHHRGRDGRKSSRR
jgi:pre-mRNA-splicing factor 38A